jgi:hypothetical protein
MVADIILKYQETIKPDSTPAKTDPPLADSDETSSPETVAADDTVTLSPVLERAALDDHLRQALQLLDNTLRKPKVDWDKVIEAVGSDKVREIIRQLQSKLDLYNQDKKIKAKADAAESRRDGFDAVKEKAAS